MITAAPASGAIQVQPGQDQQRFVELRVDRLSMLLSAVRLATTTLNTLFAKSGPRRPDP